jgi:hypothetical protein
MHCENMGVMFLIYRLKVADAPTSWYLIVLEHGI